MAVSPFDNYPGFYESDNRKHRTYNRITKESLEKRYEVLAPEWSVKGKRILDLGCCIGSFGQWCLHYGAKSYTGVEVQSEYAQTARTLLAHHGDKVRIEEETIEDFLRDCRERYDLVAVLGVLYAFVDYYGVLKGVTKICDETVLIDSLWPWKDTVSPSSPAVAFITAQGINVASTVGAVSGYGSRINPAGLKVVMATLGFVCNEPELKPRRLDSDSDVYNADPNLVGAARFLMRFKKSGMAVPTIGEGLAGRKPVGGFMKWSDTAPYDTKTDIGSWKFDDTVAKEFQTIAQTNIPDYERVIRLCLNIAKKNCAPEEKVVDVGSALGYTLKKFHEAGFSNLLGVESSESMVEASEFKSEIIVSETFPHASGPFGFVMANWTLHFIKDRERYLRDVYAGLRDGGTFVITDKMLGSDLSLDLYHDFKREAGLTEEQIRIKSESLRGVLVTYPMEWYFKTLSEIGFTHCEVVNAAPSFVTLYVRK